jgi:hypothetical protein
VIEVLNVEDLQVDARDTQLREGSYFVDDFGRTSRESTFFELGNLAAYRSRPSSNFSIVAAAARNERH